MSLWVPPAEVERQQREYRDLTKAHNRSLLDMLEMSGRVQDKWNRELRKLDPGLRLGKAKDQAHAPGVRPGFWHLVRLNEQAPFWVQPLTGPGGSFIEPNSRMLDTLRAADLQNTEAVKARRRVDEEQARARNAARAREDEDRKEELRDIVRSVTETSVSMSTDVPWSQGVAGRKGRKAD